MFLVFHGSTKILSSLLIMYAAYVEIKGSILYIAAGQMAFSEPHVLGELVQAIIAGFGSELPSSNLQYSR